jgi:hypothetical protein
MPTVKFTNHLQRYFPALENPSQVEAATVAQIVSALDARYPGLGAYIVDERGSLRKHVNIFIEEEMIHDREALRDVVSANSRVFIMQALSGG